MSQPIIQIQHLNKTFGTGEGAVHALEDINLEIQPGEIFGIIGLSGAGKSTLVRCMNLLERPTSGSVIVDGQDMTKLSTKELNKARKSISMIFQSFNLLMQRNALDNICFPLELMGVSRAKAVEKARSLLKLVGLETREKAYPAQMSGGQKQRVAIAGIIAMMPRCIVLDEATAMLDPVGRRETVDTIRTLNEQYGITVVLITHHMDEAAQAQRLIVMSQGHVIDDGPPSQVFQHVETLRAAGLAVPETVGLLYELQKEGLSVPLDAISDEACAAVLAGLLK